MKKPARLGAAAGAAVVVSIVLAGCVSSRDNDPVPAASSTTSPSAAPSATPPSDDVETPPSIPAASGDAEASAIAAAEEIMTLFARPELDAQTWIDALYPHLTEQAGFAYEGTDPANVPCRTVTGPGAIAGEPSDYAVVVQVPTDAGLYNVSLTRTSPDASWAADRIRPAEG